MLHVTSIFRVEKMRKIFANMLCKIKPASAAAESRSKLNTFLRKSHKRVKANGL